METMTSLVWFRDDLRVADHAALAAAVASEAAVVACYVFDEESPGVRPLGGAAKWWLDGSLRSLSAALAELGIPLVLRRGPAGEVVPQLAAECAATRVYWNRRYGAERFIDAALKQALPAVGIEATSFAGNLLFEPWQVTTGAGGTYRVYSAFWRACLALPAPAAPLAPPASPVPPIPSAPHAASLPEASDDLAAWALRPSHPDWAAGIAARWTPGEAAARSRLERFLSERSGSYATSRDFPAIDAGSELSPHLRWGEISPRTVWHTALAAGADVGTFLSELGWREFAWHTLYQHPWMHERPLDPRFAAFGWATPDTTALTAWRRGETGFGLVDAGMRELWQTGFMHNRVRMVAASFLTKNLLTDWRLGEAWFWDTLVDADAASNPFNWQWIAGCGRDAAPYFRIFNPTTQQTKFDAAGDYVNRWAPDSLLFPELVDLRATRVRALAAYDAIKGLPRTST